MQVTINGTLMAYEDHGAGPAVLLLHGFPSIRCFRKTQIQSLALAGYRVIAPDLRGFGQSLVTPGEYSLDILSDDIIGLLNYLGIGRVAVVGMSWGAHVMNNLLKRFPQRVVAAVSLDPLHRIDDQDESECKQDLPMLRLRPLQLDTRKGEVSMPEASKQTGLRSGYADCLPGTDNGTDLTRSMLDFLQGVKRFRPRCQLYRQVA